MADVSSHWRVHPYQRRCQGGRGFPRALLRGVNNIGTARRVAMTDLRFLSSPPGNRLEALRGDRRGYDSIRINEHRRIVFRWADGDAHEVRIIDYHS